MTKLAAMWRALLSHVAKRDRLELAILAGALAVTTLALIFIQLAGAVLQGQTQQLDERILRSLRQPQNPGVPIGPWWLRAAALDITALGAPTVLGLAVLGVVGYMLLHRMFRTALFVLVASSGGWLLNGLLKQYFERPRPDVVPHLRDVASLSFPSGHALTSAAVYLTLGAIVMDMTRGRVAKIYTMAVAMFATVAVGASRVYLGVHYPTDVLAGWLVGLSWALACWIVEQALQRRAVFQREQAQATK
jgi:undecaprenyl-diphosphatase